MKQAAGVSYLIIRNLDSIRTPPITLVLNQIFHYTRCITPKRVTSWRGFPRHCAREQNNFVRRNVAALSSH